MKLRDSASPQDLQVRGRTTVGVVSHLLLGLLALHHQQPHLEVPVNDVAEVEVIRVLAEGVDEILGHFESAKVEDELEGGEEGEVEVVYLVRVVAHQVHTAGDGPVLSDRHLGPVLHDVHGGVEVLPGKERHQEVDVDNNGDQLQVEAMGLDPALLPAQPQSVLGPG